MLSLTRSPRRLWLLLCWTALICSPGAAGQPSETESSRFLRTALALNAASPELRSRFAGTALEELYTVYSAEADLARSEARHGGNPGLNGWSAAVDRYAAQLLPIIEAVGQGYPVQIGARRERVVVIAAAGRQVMLTHPRPGQQGPFESRVLAAFCSRSDCTALTAPAGPADLLPAMAGEIRPGWSFSEDGPRCDYDGITLQFSPRFALPRMRRVCRRLFQETGDLLTEISWQLLHGASVDWQALAIRPTPGRTEYFVTLNRAGDTVLADLPLLYASPGLLPKLVPWLQRRSAGERGVTLVLDGDGVAAPEKWDVRAGDGF